MTGQAREEEEEEEEGELYTLFRLKPRCLNQQTRTNQVVGQYSTHAMVVTSSDAMGGHNNK